MTFTQVTAATTPPLAPWSPRLCDTTSTGPPHTTTLSTSSSNAPGARSTPIRRTYRARRSKQSHHLAIRCVGHGHGRSLQEGPLWLHPPASRRRKIREGGGGKSSPKMRRKDRH